MQVKILVMNNNDNNGNEADLNSVTSQGSGDNNFRFNFSDLHADKHKMSVYDVFGDDNKHHSHNNKRHSHRKRSSKTKMDKAAETANEHSVVEHHRTSICIRHHHLIPSHPGTYWDASV